MMENAEATTQGKLSKTELAIALIIAGVLVSSCFFALSENNAVEEENLRIKPRMLELAQEGNVEAIRWAFEHRFSDLKDRESLNRRLAELGDPKAMYFLAHKLEAKGDILGAADWYKRSAARGFPPAVALASRQSSGVEINE